MPCKAKGKRRGKKSFLALRDYYEKHCKSSDDDDDDDDDDNDDEGGNKESMYSVAHLSFYSLVLPVHRGSHIDFLHVLQVGVKSKRETSIHAVRAICAEKQQTLKLCRKMCSFSSLTNSPSSTSSLYATIYCFYSSPKEL